MKYLITLLAFLTLPTNVLAHAAVHTGESVAHFSTSLFHVFPIAIVLAIVTSKIAKKIYSKK